MAVHRKREISTQSTIQFVLFTNGVRTMQKINRPTRSTMATTPIQRIIGEIFWFPRHVARKMKISIPPKFHRLTPVSVHRPLNPYLVRAFEAHVTLYCQLVRICYRERTNYAIIFRPDATQRAPNRRYGTIIRKIAGCHLKSFYSYRLAIDIVRLWSALASRGVQHSQGQYSFGKRRILSNERLRIDAKGKWS